MKKQLTGILPPIATPFGADGGLDIPALKANLAKWNQTGLAGYLVLGSNGENVYLNEAEKEAVLAAAGEVIAGDKLFMAGTGCEATSATIELTNRAAELGADCALVVTPCYYKGQMTPAVLKRHFFAVADAVKIPILLYNVPQFTGVNMDPALVAEISGHENIVGIKDSSGNIGQLAAVRARCPEEFAVFVGSAPVLYPALCVGAVGGILAVAGCAPQPCLDIKAMTESGDHAGALSLQRAMTPLAGMVTTGYGIGGLKAAMDMAGYQGGHVRPPLTMPDGTARGLIEAELKKLGAST